MLELKDLLLKNINDIDLLKVLSFDDEIKEVFVANTKQLIDFEYKVGRCRIWVDDNDIIKFVVVEQANGKELRVDSEPPLDTSDWPKRARLHKIQDPWS